MRSPSLMARLPLPPPNTKTVFFPAAIFPVFEAFRGFGEGGQNVAAFSRHQSVCESGREIAFVREAGDFQFFSREYDGQSHIAALGKYNVGAEGFQAFRGLFFRAEELRGDFEVF